MQNEGNDTAPSATVAKPADPSTLERIERAFGKGLAQFGATAKRDLVAAEHEAIAEFHKIVEAAHEWIRRRTSGAAGETMTVHLQTAGHQLDGVLETVGVHYAQIQASTDAK